MQTPLVTNFSRGILSPKFFGRVETELYAAGAAQIENFIVNNQGSLQRRPGTYRVWNTNWTHPAEDADPGKFAVSAIENQRYSLTVLADGDAKAQLILSTQGEHRFFEIHRGEYEGNGDAGLLVLTEYESGGNKYPEAHAFSMGEGSGQIVDDAFRVTIGDVTFLRSRSALDYTGLKTRVWHNALSRKIARSTGTTTPFVTVTPFYPPKYVKLESVVSQSVGATAKDRDGNTRESIFGKKITPHAVGVKYRGQYEDVPERGRLVGVSGENNATETQGEDADWVEIAVPHAFEYDSNYTFYNHYPGRAKLEIDGRPLTGRWVQNVDTTTQTIQISLEIFETLGVTDFVVVYVRRRRVKRNFRSNKTKWYYKRQTFSASSEIAAKKTHFTNRTYSLDTAVSYAEAYSYEVRLYDGSGVELKELDPSEYTIANDGTNVTGVTILDEYSIRPGGKKPMPGDYFSIKRIEVDLPQDIIARRVKPWSRTEVPIDNALEYVSDDVDWLEQSKSAIAESKSVGLASGRMVLLEEEDDLKFRVSASKDYANFSEGESEADAYDFSIETDTKESLRWMVSMREGVVLGTDKNEYVVVNIHSPSGVAARRYTGFGSSRPYAIRFGDKILFVSRDSKRVFAYMYSDELSAWHSQDITSVAQHLFDGGIQSVHYQQDPMSIIWVVPEGNDGIYALTWEDSTGVMAWTHHFAGTTVLAATPVTVEDTTVLMVAVDRNGYVVIEALDLSKTPDDDVYYVDSAEYLFFETIENDPDTVYGPDGVAMTENYSVEFGTGRWARFQGKEIAFMVDGATEKVMTGGNVPHTNSIVTIGPFAGADIPINIEEDETMVTVGIGEIFTSKMQTLPILVQSPSGAGIFKDTQVQKIRVRVDSSGAFLAGNDPDDLTRVELGEEESMYLTNNGYYTGDVQIGIQSRWMRRPQIVIESYYSDPLTILALMVDAQVYE